MKKLLAALLVTVVTACNHTPPASTARMAAVEPITIQYQTEYAKARDVGFESVARALHFPALDGLTIRVGECGTANAYYSRDEEGDGVLICTELVAEEKPESLRWILAHEMGHALIHRAGLPITGSDEDAADEFATVVMIAAGMEDTVAAAADMFWTWGQDDVMEYYTDTHSSNRRRAYDQKCLLEGSRGTVYANLVGCEYRWRKVVKRWATLLESQR